ncbi:MAG: hypothetical protein ACLFNR_01600 [Candidatus Paceibacterota bacterium]
MSFLFKEPFYEKNGREKGITIVEILFSVAIVASFLGAIILAFLLYMQIATAAPQHTAAVFLADEGLEAVRSIRNRGWESEIESLQEDTSYNLYFSEGNWHATTTEQVIEGTFVREFVLKEVSRDSEGRIDETGSIDDGSRRVDVVVTWDGLVGESQVEVSSYIMDIFN